MSTSRGTKAGRAPRASTRNGNRAVSNGNPKAYYFAGPKPGPDPDVWRAAADRVPGTWWEHWADWVSARSGEEVTAPKTLGSKACPVLESAPGSYVLERIPAIV
jgi:polyhydroxyalkanoate synthase subunit PhaC